MITIIANFLMLVDALEDILKYNQIQRLESSALEPAHKKRYLSVPDNIETILDVKWGVWTGASTPNDYTSANQYKGTATGFVESSTALVQIQKNVYNCV